LVVGVDVDAVQICDARTGLSVSPILRHSGGRETALIRTASFSHDDARLLTVGEEGIVVIWNATSYQLERKLVLKHPVAIAQFSPDDRFIVVGDRRGHATIWSAESGVQLGSIPDYVEEVMSLAFPPRGATFVAGCVNGTARCYTLPTGEPAGPLLQHRGIVWSVAYSPDGTRILTASADRTAQIWDAQSGRPLLKPLRHEKDVRSARFSPDGKWILTTSEDGTARVWSAVTAEPLSVLRHSAVVRMGTFSPDSRWVATGSEDRTVRLWDPQSGLPISDPLPHPGPVARLAFSPDGQRLLAFGGQPKLWDVVVAPTPVPPWFCELAEAVGGYRLGPDGEALPASPQILVTLRERLGSGMAKDFYSRWAEWFLLDRMKDLVPAFGSRQ
jgi:WD40 repeat protein